MNENTTLIDGLHTPLQNQQMKFLSFFVLEIMIQKQ